LYFLTNDLLGFWVAAGIIEGLSETLKQKPGSQLGILKLQWNILVIFSENKKALGKSSSVLDCT